MLQNRQEEDILIALSHEAGLNQRELAKKTSHSLGKVNQSIRSLYENGYITKNYQLTPLGVTTLEMSRPKNAIILAAGCGMRMVPINTMTPKGLLEVHDQPLIERLILQLKEVGVENIYIVVGFMKEAFEYLIDEYNVRLIVNPHYQDKNNLYSLYLANMAHGNTYIIPSDLYCYENPFSPYELSSYYLVSDAKDSHSNVRINNKYELTYVKEHEPGNRMIGITYLTKEDVKLVFYHVERLLKTPIYHQAFFEKALEGKNGFIIPGKVIPNNQIVEINTYEQLLELDQNSKQLDNTAIEIIKKTFQVDANQIKEIEMLKKGMTNRSFFFQVDHKKYIMRIPGEGTDQLINRKEEAEVYQLVSKTGISDHLVYINPDNGYKITEYIENSRCCNPESDEDLNACMDVLRKFHQKKLSVSHSFNPFRLIDFYESLWNGKPSAYRDYKEVKQAVLSLEDYILQHAKPYVLCHIDAVPDNFLISKDENNQEVIHLIDWEYAGMQDPDIDIAMFAIYSLYSKGQVDHLIDIYYNNQCSQEIRIKIYAYISICGLLWSNWCEYKRNLGVEFGEYSLAQYRFAKEYYRYVNSYLNQ